MKTTFRIALLPGDGIGPDVTAEAVRVLQEVARRTDDLHFEMEEFSIGAGEYLKSAQAAFGGTKRERNSADLAAGSESVVREFLRSSGAVGRGAARPSNHPFSRARRLQPERFLKS